MNSIQNIKNELQNYPHSQSKAFPDPQSFQIPQHHIENLKNFVLTTNMSPEDMIKTLFPNNFPVQKLYSNFNPMNIKTESNSSEHEESSDLDEVTSSDYSEVNK